MVESEFRYFCAAHGFEPDAIFADGTLRRFDGPGEVRGKRSAWYVLHGGDLPCGIVGDWRTGEKHIWRERPERLEPMALQHQRERTAAAIRAAEAERQTRVKYAAAKCEELWARAGFIDAGHPYLKSKPGMRPYGARQLHASLLVPLRDVDGGLLNLQFIKPDGSKRFKTHGRVTAAFCLLGDVDPAGPVVVCEGWATACTIREATGYAVAAAMHAGNLLPVAKALRQRYPAARMLLAADDDHQTAGNPGLTKARAAAEAAGAALVVPAFGPDRPAKATDFDDLRQFESPGAVARQIHRGLA